MSKIDLLKWQVEMGADEAIEEHLIDRAAKKVEIQMKETPVIRRNATEYNIADQEMVVVQNKDIREKVEQKFSGPLELERKAREIADNCKTLDELREAVKNFDGLAIKKTATNTVFSDGNPQARVMLIGEAPGANEDMEGIPFCGVSGKLMDGLLNWAGFFRDKNIYISNTIFWRPPGNRTPTPEELAICRPFVEKHIALVNPAVLGLIGGTATLSLLNTTVGISKLRTKTHSYKNKYMDCDIPVFAFFHPSYLLRQPSQKKTFWFDLLKMKKHLKNNGITL